MKTRFALFTLICVALAPQESFAMWAVGPTSSSSHQRVLSHIDQMISRNQKQLDYILSTKKSHYSLDFMTDQMRQNFEDADAGMDLAPHSVIGLAFEFLRDRIGRENFHNENNNYKDYSFDGAKWEFETTLGFLTKMHTLVAEGALTPTQQTQIQTPSQIAPTPQPEKPLENLLNTILTRFQTGRIDQVQERMGDLNLVQAPSLRGTDRLQNEVNAFVRGFLRSHLNEITQMHRDDWSQSTLQIEVQANLNSFRARPLSWVHRHLLRRKPVYDLSLNIVAIASVPWAPPRTTSNTINLTLQKGQLILDTTNETLVDDTFAQLGQNAADLYTESKFRPLPKILNELLQKVSAEQIQSTLVRVDATPSPCKEALQPEDSTVTTETSLRKTQ